jgi:DNA-binding transcriptional LysR family regulator
MSLTNEGETYLLHAERILSDVKDLEQLVTSSREKPKGLLRVCVTPGFGRNYLAPAISSFVREYPEVEVQLMLYDRSQNLGEGDFDVAVRFGEPTDGRFLARKIAANRRFICASPLYLKANPPPAEPADLHSHNCLILRQNDAAYGHWRFSRGTATETIKVRGSLSSNDGEIIVNWALDGHGIAMRAEWDIARYIRSGRLVRLLTDYELPAADIYALFPERHNLSAKVTVFIDYLTSQFKKRAEQDSGEDTRW